MMAAITTLPITIPSRWTRQELRRHHNSWGFTSRGSTVLQRGAGSSYTESTTSRKRPGGLALSSSVGRNGRETPTSTTTTCRSQRHWPRDRRRVQRTASTRAIPVRGLQYWSALRRSYPGRRRHHDRTGRWAPTSAIQHRLQRHLGRPLWWPGSWRCARGNPEPLSRLPRSWRDRQQQWLGVGGGMPGARLPLGIQRYTIWNGGGMHFLGTTATFCRRARRGPRGGKLDRANPEVDLLPQGPHPGSVTGRSTSSTTPVRVTLTVNPGVTVEHVVINLDIPKPSARTWNITLLSRTERRASSSGQRGGSTSRATRTVGSTSADEQNVPRRDSGGWGGGSRTTSARPRLLSNVGFLIAGSTSRTNPLLPDEEYSNFVTAASRRGGPARRVDTLNAGASSPPASSLPADRVDGVDSHRRQNRERTWRRRGRHAPGIAADNALRGNGERTSEWRERR